MQTFVSQQKGGFYGTEGNRGDDRLFRLHREPGAEQPAEVRFLRHREGDLGRRAEAALPEKPGRGQPQDRPLAGGRGGQKLAHRHCDGPGLESLEDEFYARIEESVRATVLREGHQLGRP